MLEPMLATRNIPPPNKLYYPLLSSKKFNGFRCLVLDDGNIRTRSGKEFPNKNIPKLLEDLSKIAKTKEYVFDGELYSPSSSWGEHLQTVMAINKDLPKDLAFHCFDLLTYEEWNNPRNIKPFQERFNKYTQVIEQGINNVLVVNQVLCHTWNSIEDFFTKEVESGGEGLIIRDPNGGYKHGRCTTKEGIMFKLKPFEEISGVVIGVNARKKLVDGAKEVINTFGKLKRTSKKEDHVELAELGSLEVLLDDGRSVNVGSGLDWNGGDKDRKLLWELNQVGKLIGKRLDIKCTEVGSKDRPLLPIFIRWREDE